MDSPSVSVIICCYTYERLNDIHEAVESVLKQTLQPHEVIIAVDHNKDLCRLLAETYAAPRRSDRHSGSMAGASDTQAQVPNAEPRVPILLVLNEGASGLSETRNVGIRASSGNIVAFIDDDAVAEHDWLENLSKPFQSQQNAQTGQSTQGTVVAVGGQAIPIWLDGKRPSWFPEELDWIIGCTYKGLHVDGNEIRNVMGCNMAFRKGVFGIVGLFRSDTGRIGEIMGCGEETDLCLRINQHNSGAVIVYEQEAVIYHKVVPHRTAWKYLLRRSYNEGFYKSVLVRAGSRRAQAALSTEGSYARHLLVKALPQRLVRFYQRDSPPQATALILSMVAVATGYLVGWVRGWARGSDANGQSESMDSGLGTQQGKVPNQRYEGEG